MAELRKRHTESTAAEDSDRGQEPESDTVS